MKKRDHIIFCAGGTAGHTFPAAALAKEIKDHGYKTTLITDLRGAKYVNDEFTRVNILPIARLGLGYFLKSPYLMLKSGLIVFKCDKVVCFGGYVSLFPFIAATILRKETIIYQLDSHVTRLNRVLIPFATDVIYGFAQTNLKQRRNTYCFGIPVRKGFEFSFIKKGEYLNIAVVGGSLGSAYWKKLIIDTLENLPEKMRHTIRLYIQTKDDIKGMFDKYNLASVESKTFYDTAKLFSKCHLIIARAGATSIAEISSVARAAYLVPWESAVENHQYENARSYAGYKGAEFGNDSKKLAEYIIKIAQSNEYFYQVCDNASKAFPQYAKNKASAFIVGNEKYQDNSSDMVL